MIKKTKIIQIYKFLVYAKLSYALDKTYYLEIMAHPSNKLSNKPSYLLANNSKDFVFQGHPLSIINERINFSLV